MKNSFLVWFFIIGIVAAVLFAFNYQSGDDKVALSEIFPEEKTFPVDVDYEFVDQAEETVETVPVKEPVKAAGSGETTASKEFNRAEPAKAETKMSVPAQIKSDLSKADTSFTIQIASFKTKEAAETSLAKVLEKGYQGYIVSRDLGDKGTWHRVYIGAFKDKPEALQELSKVQADYPGSFIIAPK